MRGKSELKVHLLALVMVIISELIGIRRIQLGTSTVLLLPMLYALVIGMFLPSLRLTNRADMDTASPFIGFSVMFLTAKMGAEIGPNLSKILSAGPALVLQEFGNLGTIFLAVPVGILVLRMGREVVGSSFSISREGSLAIVADIYGLDSPEGRGVMGAYITGTLFGAIFNGLMAGFIITTGLFHPISLAMAAGTGSASMMAAALGPLVAAYPDMAEELTAYAASSQLLSSVDGLYMSLFLAIPITEWLYRKLGGPPADKAEPATAGQKGDK
ncbi:MAG: DUF3100 domain-containing protein [Firmicutes bacterium]|nr:DUF3100 domain-containing protein [Bacillota bacterium]